MFKIYRKILASILAMSMIICSSTAVFAGDFDSKTKVSMVRHYNVESNSSKLQSLEQKSFDDAIQYESNYDGDSEANEASGAKRTYNKYMWNYSTAPYYFSEQTWSTNMEIYGTYPKNSDDFVTAGYLLNPRGPLDYAAALREGYLDDSSYQTEGGHYYQCVISDINYNNVIFMLESNAEVFIFDNDINLIYRSTDELGIGSYFTRYYSTTKTIAGVTNRVICMGLNTGNYFFVFGKGDDSITGNSHYGFYTGQPLPIAQSASFSDTVHYTTIHWDQHSSSQSAVTQSISISCPNGTADEYALTKVTFVDRSRPFANNTYASSIQYYYMPSTAGYYIQLSQPGGWWNDLIDSTPPSGSIDGTYNTKVTVNWRNGISYVNASCTTMTQMTIEYLVPYGIIVG